MDIPGAAQRVSCAPARQRVSAATARPMDCTERPLGVRTGGYRQCLSRAQEDFAQDYETWFPNGPYRV